MIFQQSIWHYPSLNDSLTKQYSEAFNVEPLIAQLLIERGLKTKSDVDRFLKPALVHLHDPFLLSGMSEACERVKNAIANKENIWIYGDYDVDGITSIAILCHYFRWIGIDVQYYIPNRHDEGYGINVFGLDAIKSQKGDLIITVDCGITAVEQIEYAKSIGLDVIITDHHECQETIPSAVAVINPKMGDYPFRMLAGCGVALKLVQALAGPRFVEFSELVVDIAALGTVADIVPLIDENRIITSLGLKRMMHTSNPGIQALIHEADLKEKEINAGHIGFIIAPRINASGRIGNPSIAVEMLLESDYYKALQIAKELSRLNSERQIQEREIMDASERYILNHVDLERERILLVVGENWHTGIIGIVASKLSDKYSRPTVILNLDDEKAKGSARSIEGISIYEVLSNFKHLFEKFGGHEQAAGLSLKRENVAVLRESLIRYGAEFIPKYMLISHQKVSALLKPQMITHRLVEEIEQLKPFGTGNSKPQFVFENLNIEDYKIIGKTGTHLKLLVNDGVRIYDALAFNAANAIASIRKNDRVHLLLNLEKNHFLGVETIQFLIKDFIKDKMPLKKDVELMVSRAIAQYIKEGKHFVKYSKFTSVDTFDIIFSVTGEKPLLIYSLEALYAFRDYVLSNNIVKYTLHFSEIIEKECREGYLNVAFMPLNPDYPEAYTVEETFGSAMVQHFIPVREDLTYFYKTIESIKTIDLFELSSKTHMNQTKILICLELLSEMSLISYTIMNGCITVKGLPKPMQKISLDHIPLFKRIHTEPLGG